MTAWGLLVLVCVASRVVTTITYVEDPDSLRFALSVADAYDLAELQPHFPGYPVFWAVVKPLYVLLGSFSTAFSIVGGLATAGLVAAMLHLWKKPLVSPEGIAVAAVVGLNPLFWLMANRYMPDLLGTTCALAAAAALVHAVTAPDRRTAERAALVGAVLTGLLAGLRLSYLPFLAIPALAALWTSRRRLRLLAAGCASVAVWLVPMTVDTGGATLVDVAWAQTTGHFTEFGGTVQTESDLGRRTAGFVRGLWADALGGWWPGRHPITGLVGAGGLALGVVGARQVATQLRAGDRRVGLLLACAVVYAVWVFFFQNVIHKSRHVLPLVPLLLFLPAAGAVRLWTASWTRSPWARGLVLVVTLAYAVVTGVLVHQHRSPSAIAQAKAFVETQAAPSDAAPPVRVASVPLVNTYLRAQDVQAEYYSVEDSTDVRRLRAAERGRTLVVGTYGSLLNRSPTEVQRFYHNPYVNRMWSEVTVYVYAN